MNLYLSNQVLIKLDQLKLLIAVSQSAFPCFWPSCHIIPNTCWVPTKSVLTLVIIAAQRRKWCEVFRRCCWVLGLRDPRSIACEVWSLHFQDKLYNSDNLYSLLILFSWYYCWFFTDEVTICMELDPAIHIVMHSVLSLKTGCDSHPLGSHPESSGRPCNAGWCSDPRSAGADRCFIGYQPSSERGAPARADRYFIGRHSSFWKRRSPRADHRFSHCHRSSFRSRSLLHQLSLPPL
jgi:hypothetical protein